MVGVGTLVGMSVLVGLGGTGVLLAGMGVALGTGVGARPQAASAALAKMLKYKGANFGEHNASCSKNENLSPCCNAGFWDVAAHARPRATLTISKFKRQKPSYNLWFDSREQDSILNPPRLLRANEQNSWVAPHNEKKECQTPYGWHRLEQVSPKASVVLLDKSRRY